MVVTSNINKLNDELWFPKIWLVVVEIDILNIPAGEISISYVTTLLLKIVYDNAE